MKTDLSINEKISDGDKAAFISTIEALQEQTQAVENDYKNMKDSYEAMQKFLAGIIESVPVAVWVLEDDTVILQNSFAEKLKFDVALKNVEGNSVLSLNNVPYMIKKSKFENRDVVIAVDISGQKTV